MQDTTGLTGTMRFMKLIKVTLEYNNGEKHSLEGKEAQEWLEEANSYVVIQSLRTGTGGMKERKWKITKELKEHD